MTFSPRFKTDVKISWVEGDRGSFLREQRGLAGCDFRQAPSDSDLYNARAARVQGVKNPNRVDSAEVGKEVKGQILRRRRSCTPDVPS